MKLTIEHHDTKYSCDTRESKSLAIKMDFEGPQPNHFGTEKAKTSVLKIEGFTGDTKKGGSCNVDTLEIIPHCNGTHTETVSHIVDEDIWIGHAAMDVMSLAMLITVTPENAKGAIESYRPPLADEDKIITAAALKKAIATVGDPIKVKPSSLIIRTTPNDIDKCSRAYSAKQSPSFLTIEAMELVNELGFNHLLVDVPSVDKMYDDGLLTNHHIFWQVVEKTHTLTGETRQDKTISEMIFVDDAIADGLFILNLQVPAFCSDAAPSRPIIFPANQVD
ncbi:MAG: cyclase family protein [Mariniblastus sp.]